MCKYRQGVTSSIVLERWGTTPPKMGKIECLAQGVRMDEML